MLKVSETRANNWRGKLYRGSTNWIFWWTMCHMAHRATRLA